MSQQVHLACPDPPAPAIARLVQSEGFEITGFSRSLDELIHFNLASNGLVLISDLLADFPSMVDAVRRLRVAHPRARIILLLSEDLPALTDECMKAGVYDWTVGDNLPHELPGLLRKGRSYADLAGMPETPAPAPLYAQQEAFGRATPYRILMALPAPHLEKITALVERKLATKVQVTGKPETFEALLEEAPESDGVVTSLTLPSVAGFDPGTRLRMLSAAAPKVVVQWILGPNDPEGFETQAQEKGMLVQRATPSTNGRASLSPAFLSSLSSALEQRRVVSDITRRAETTLPTDTPILHPKPVLMPTSTPAVRPAPARIAAAAQLVPVSSTLVGIVSAASGVGKSTAAVTIAMFAARLGISTLLMDLSIQPPGNAALRLGFRTEGAGLELLLQGPFHDEVFSRLRVQYRETPLWVLQPVSNKILGPLSGIREEAYRDLFRAAKMQYPLTIVDTSSVLEDPSVVNTLRACDRTIVVLDSSDDRLAQTITRLPFLLRTVSSSERLVFFVNKMARGGYSLDDIRQSILEILPKATVLSAPSEVSRHLASVQTHVPLSWKAPKGDPWAKLFLAVAGDMIPMNRRHSWTVLEPVEEVVTTEPRGSASSRGGLLDLARGLFRKS